MNFNQFLKTTKPLFSFTRMEKIHFYYLKDAKQCHFITVGSWKSFPNSLARVLCRASSSVLKSFENHHTNCDLLSPGAKGTLSTLKLNKER